MRCAKKRADGGVLKEETNWKLAKKVTANTVTNANREDFIATGIEIMITDNSKKPNLNLWSLGGGSSER